MNVEKQVQYWIGTAEENVQTAESMLKNGHYDWCLFVGQLAIEKILKAIVVQTTKGYAPRIHDLVKLAELTNISFSQE